MKVKSIKTRLFKENENLEAFIIEHLPGLESQSIVVVTSKIVALSEGRTAALKDKDKILWQEAERMIPAKYAWLTIKDGMLMPSAGIDESNAQGKLILLPRNSYETAARVRDNLRNHFGITNLGVLITDSRVWPLRAGSVGVATGYAGFEGLKDYRGTVDLFGRELKVARTNIADSLAAAAVLLMGEGSESTPIAVINKAPVQFTDRVNNRELVVPFANDLYAPLFDKMRPSEANFDETEI